MSLRKLILLSLCVALCASVAVALLLHLESGGTKPGASAQGTRGPADGRDTAGAWAYVTEKELVLMRGDKIIVRVPRLSDNTDSDDYKTVWTHSGDYLAMFSDAKVRQDDPSELQLIIVKASSGVVRRAPCPYCFGITPVGANAILAEASSASNTDYHLLKFNLDQPGPGVPVPGFATIGTSLREFRVSSRNQVITNQYGDDGREQVNLWNTDGTTDVVLEHIMSNDYMPAAVSGGDAKSSTVFAVAFRTNPGSCGPFPVYLFTSDGYAVETDMSNAAPNGSVMYKYGVNVNDLWWGIDGHFHATIQPVNCPRAADNSVNEVGTAPSSTWRLDNNVWFHEGSTETTMLRPLDKVTNVVFVEHNCDGGPPVGVKSVPYCNTGVLYYEIRGNRTALQGNVLTISAPTPQKPLIAASPIPTTGFSADQKFAPYVGTWTQHGYTLTIRKDFTGEVVGINAPSANEGSGQPGFPDYRERATFTFTVLPSGVTAHVKTASTPNAPGTPYFAPWYTVGADVPLRMNDEAGVIDLGDSHYCGPPGTYPWAGLCGA